MKQKRNTALIDDAALERVILRPDPSDPRLTRIVDSVDQTGKKQQTRVIVERPLTIYLNETEIVTAMTIGDHPEVLAVGYLINQRILTEEDDITSVEFEDDIDVVVVRTAQPVAFQNKLKKRTLTSGCAQGTVFGDMMEALEGVKLPAGPNLKTSDLSTLLRTIAGIPSLYLEAGAIHGCALCSNDTPLLYVEDVGRHNAVDKIAGHMHLNNIDGSDKIFFTTGRLTSEMVIKTIAMGVPILVSRSGLTHWGVELAREFGLTLIARAKGSRFTAVSGLDRLVFDDTDMKELGQ